MTRFFATLAALSLASAAVAQTEQTAQNGALLSASFVDGDGQPTGSASLGQTNSGVLIEIEVQGLPANSWVAFHIHENGTCDHADGFQSAGGHFDPAGAEHGFMPEGGPHAGDMPNQYVPESGVLRAQTLNTFVSLEDGDTDIRGRTLIIHAGTDDYQSQPSGDAGNRIACAAIE